MQNFPLTAHFDDPGEVVRASGLDRAQKRWLLEDWIVDERALQTADDEGMGGGRPPRLREVQTALRRLDQASAALTGSR